MSKKIVHHEGERFGILTIIREVTGHGNATFECLCDCGKTALARGIDLRYGTRKSCGCLWGKNRLTHGAAIDRTHTPTYSSWHAMIQRCCNPNNSHYSYYGGRGIMVCDRWRNSYEAFLKDMGPRPSGMTIDRNDNEGNYEPSNCHWATRLEQSHNSRPKRKKVRTFD